VRIYPNFKTAIENCEKSMVFLSYDVQPDNWQGQQIGERPEAQMKELFNTSFQIQLGEHLDLDHWRQDIKPNLSWADRHFEEERVSGMPINPGETWKIWPWGHNAKRSLMLNGKFNHSYAERMWPKRANHNLKDEEWLKFGKSRITQKFPPLTGIRYLYADLNDLVDHLQRNPNTRQAYLPIWFPEDGSHDDRKPCTLGYHFIQRNGYFHCTYYIRSCDIVRHFRDDLYLTLRLQLWILEKLKELNPDVWEDVQLGSFVFHCVSLHCFINDWIKLCEGYPDYIG